MSASGGISQLLKGIIIGVVLIMAIIGTMSLLDKGNPLSSMLDGVQKTNPNTQENKEILSPSITLKPDNTQRIENNNSANIGDLNAEIIDEKEKAVVNNSNTQQNKPILENERTAEEAKKEEINYGMMELKAVNPNNNESLKATYSVFDSSNVKVAESKDSVSASYRLPSGQYKVETTLMKTDEITNQIIPVATKSRYIIVRTNSTSRQTFELNPPATTGVLQVSAKINNKTTRANFVIQKANGEIVASRNNVTSSLFKLNTGTYKVSVNSGNSKGFRSIEIKAGESIQSVFDLKEVTLQGKLLVRIFDTQSSNPVRADIKISAANGAVIQDLKASAQTELTLAEGNYKISVIGPNGTSNKNITINPGKTTNEIFRFELPSNNTTQVANNVTIKPVEKQKDVIEDNTNNDRVTLTVFARDQNTNRPIKSNIYIQTLSGKHLDKKNYVDTANFNLEPGVYKVTVRSNNRQNNVKNIRISKNQNLSETFLMVNPASANVKPNNSQNTNVASTSPEQLNPQTTIETGFLNIVMQAPNNQQGNRIDLRSNFIVTTLSGKKIVELKSVKGGNLKLDVGSYNVTAIHNNKPLKRRINISPNQNTRLVFNSSEFLASKGVLRSRIVDESGRPLKGNLSVSNMAGQIVARANNVSSAVFNLPPIRHSVSVNFQGLSGNEVVNIRSNQTTVQTFTIAPNNNANQNNGQQRNQSRDIKEILKEKIKKEIRRTF